MYLVYKYCAECLTNIFKDDIGLKTAIYKVINNIKYNGNLSNVLLKLCSSIYNNLDELSEIYEIQLLEKKDKNNVLKVRMRYRKFKSYTIKDWLHIIYIHEYLYSARGIIGGGKIKRKVDEKLKGMSTEFINKANQNMDTTQNEYKYIRVDNNFFETSEILAELNKLYNINTVIDKHFDFLIKVQSYDIKKIVNWDKILNGKIYIMDKASCLSAVSLNVQKYDIILDICSSPGSKALHFLSMLKFNGLLVCIEKDYNRAEELLKRLNNSSYFTYQYMLNLDTACKIIVKRNTVCNKNNIILLTDEKQELNCIIIIADYFDILYCNKYLSNCVCNENNKKKSLNIGYEHKICLNKILKLIDIRNYNVNSIKCSIDPSCSCSGLKNFFTKKANGLTRIKSLAKLQLNLFKKIIDEQIASTIVYTTCSIYTEENESVILKSLHNNSTYQLIRPDIEWDNSNLDSYAEEINDNIKKISTKCLRCNNEVNQTRGFFLAKLVQL